MNLKKLNREIKKFQKDFFDFLKSSAPTIKKTSLLISSLLITAFVFNSSYKYFNSKFKEEYINVSHFKKLAKNLISSRLKKAIDIGVIDFN
ncbi:MAG: hypothetical protein HUU45_12320, partial [Leptospiraceae bacterium]|nr:hypothetical protein [Leptospiraceae bacterium]